jgi:hypothetical protein
VRSDSLASLHNVAVATQPPPRDLEKRTGRAVLPVGFPLGLAVAENGGREDQPYEIRKGAGAVDLAEPQYRLWLLAFDGLSRPDLLAACRTQEIAYADEIVDHLLRVGALVELEDDPAANVRLLERLRLHPMGIGVGNSRERPREWRIALPGLGVSVTVDIRVYMVWSDSVGAGSLADHCRRLARDVGVEPARILGQVTVNLALLLQQGVAYLDEAAPGTTEAG